MAGKNPRNDIIAYSITGTVVLIGTVALMLFGVGSTVSADIGPLLAGLAVSTYVFRFGLPWKWLNFLFLVSFLGVAFVLGYTGLMWMGGYIAGAHLGVAWRTATVKPKVKSKWMVNDEGFNTLTDARTEARKVLLSLDGKKNWRLVIEHGPARFEVAGELPSKMVCHRSHDADDHRSWAVLMNPEHTADESIKVPMGRDEGFIPSRFVNEIEAVDAALKDFLKNPKAESLSAEWNTDLIAADLRLGS